METKEISISVTELALYVCRSGNLSSGSFGSIKGTEGTRLHRKVFDELKKLYNDKIETEVSMKTIYEGDFLSLNINGRADVKTVTEDNTPLIIEIKSFNSNVSSYDKLKRDEHEAQLKLYGSLYLIDHPELNLIKLQLRYVSINTLETISKEFDYTRDDAMLFFEKICGEYMEFAEKLINYQVNSRDSIAHMTFPYDKVRAGQKEFMRNVLTADLCMEALFVEAPTGIGKTISTLYPSVKGLLKNQYDKIFYLTSKTATRRVAVKAINDMRQSGLLIRSILLSSKESMCPYGGKCDSKYCELAIGYYSRLKPALEEVLNYDDINPELVSKVAMKHRVCPHELSLDALNYCDIVIGDYNHAFDPRVTLIRCFKDQDEQNHVLLVDEAHNLIDRSRNMFSAEFNYTLLKDLIVAMNGKNPKIEGYLLRLDQYFKVALHLTDNCQSAFSALEEVPEKECLVINGFQSTRTVPRKLYELMWKTLHFLSPYMDTLSKGDLRSKVMEFFFECRFFLTIIEHYYNDSYITCLQKFENSLIVKLMCLDASDKLREQIENKHSAVFFSATLSPYEYYKNCLIGKNDDICRELKLPSPFPPENLEVIIEDKISTTYKDRMFTARRIAERVSEELKYRTGNFMIFFPSFEYMESVCKLINEYFDKETSEDKIKRELIIQTRNMNAVQKDEFLDNFNSKSDHILLGACVLGGHFGEGIDLVGDRLSGVITVGVGIPQISPEREILSNYYSEKFGDGFAFAYRFPGWEKVLQAVGRVIRTEEDTGFALLIDERLSKPEYIMLFPDHWEY